MGLDKTMKITEIKAAHFNAGLKVVVYIAFPYGVEAMPNTVMELPKSLYGLHKLAETGFDISRM